jgi:hypothetical protein
MSRTQRFMKIRLKERSKLLTFKQGTRQYYVIKKKEHKN